MQRTRPAGRKILRRMRRCDWRSRATWPVDSTRTLQLSDAIPATEVIDVGSDTLHCHPETGPCLSSPPIGRTTIAWSPRTSPPLPWIKSVTAQHGVPSTPGFGVGRAQRFAAGCLPSRESSAPYIASAYRAPFCRITWNFGSGRRSSNTARLHNTMEAETSCVYAVLCIGCVGSEGARRIIVGHSRGGSFSMPVPPPACASLAPCLPRPG